jgi:hypothetical protein
LAGELDVSRKSYSEEEMAKAAFPLGRGVQRTGYPLAVRQLKFHTRELLGLSDDVTISVTELTCREPGCPDIETVVAILSEAQKPIIVRIHSAIPDVTLDQLREAFEAGLRT